jgi:hypothetical protein
MAARWTAGRRGYAAWRMDGRRGSVDGGALRCSAGRRRPIDGGARGADRFGTRRAGGVAAGGLGGWREEGRSGGGLRRWRQSAQQPQRWAASASASSGASISASVKCERLGKKRRGGGLYTPTPLVPVGGSNRD